MKIRLLNPGEQIPYDLLLSADPSIEVIGRYLDRNYTYVAEKEGRIAAVYILYPVEADIIEIKNIAVAEDCRNQGVGTALLVHAAGISRDSGYSKLIIGTADVSLSPLSLYQKNGFKISGVKKNFFVDNYPEPVFDDGERCVDMVMLEKNLL